MLDPSIDQPQFPLVLLNVYDVPQTVSHPYPSCTVAYLTAASLARRDGFLRFGGNQSAQGLQCLAGIPARYESNTTTGHKLANHN